MISFKSEITKKVLNYFFLNPHESQYVNELSRKLSLDKRNLVKKIRDLEKEGLLKSEVRGNMRLYSLNKHYPLLAEMKNIFLKTAGVENKLRTILNELPGVKKAFLFGSYAQDKMSAHSDIDLLIVGNHKIIALQKKLSALQKELEREINAINMDEPEFAKKRRNQDPFISNIFKNKTIELK
jgi:predicted nucleotidyltransferase/predicted transcriptional regulator with HTH domain